MATTINNRGISGVETHLVINSSSTSSGTSSSSSSSTKTSTNSPRNELMANCSLLLNEDTDENPSDVDNNNTNNKFSSKQRDDVESRLLGNTSYHTNQFNKYLLSSPLVSSKNSKTNEDDGPNDGIELKENESDFKMSSDSRTNTLTKKTNSKLPPIMMMRSHNFTNGKRRYAIKSTFNVTDKSLLTFHSQVLREDEYKRFLRNISDLFL